MIIGNIQQLEIEKAWIPNNMYKLIRQAMAMHPESLAPGRYELGNSHYMNIDEVETECEEKRRFEAHQEFADIQILLVGHEMIGYAPLTAMGNCVEALVDKDLYFYEYEGAYTKIDMLRGTFAIFLPGDAHKPLIAHSNKPAKVKKAIIKANLNKLI